MDHQEFDYYYGDERSQFSFYRIPRQLVTSERFYRLSTDAKLLYGLLLDRMSLSAKNGWYDGAGRVYIYYTLGEIQNDLRCAHGKAVKLLAELDKGKGFGLIERVNQEQGRPTKIYVKRFTTRNVPPPSPEPEPEPDPVPRPPIFSSQDFRKSDGSYIESNQTESSYTDPSIAFRAKPRIDRSIRLPKRNKITDRLFEPLPTVYPGRCRRSSRTYSRYLEQHSPNRQDRRRNHSNKPSTKPLAFSGTKSFGICL